MSIPQLKDKYKYEAAVSAEQLIAYFRKNNNYSVNSVPENIVLTDINHLLTYTITNFKTTRIRFFGKWLYILKNGEKEIGIVQKNIGAPAAALQLEILIACKAKNFIAISMACTLQKSIPIGSIVICNKALRDEGTSYHYLKPSKFITPSFALLKVLVEQLNKDRVSYHIGPTWTTDAIFRETMPEIEKYQKEKILTVDMEASALFAIAKYRKVHFVSTFLITDSLTNLKWEISFQNKEIKKNALLLFEAVLKTLQIK